MIGLWRHRADTCFGAEPTYAKAAEWLDPCETVEDWGCGTCYAKRYFSNAKYVGIDGSGEFCDVRADLREYKSRTPGILLRHVLEHNTDWRLILANALESFTERMAIVFFKRPGQGERITNCIPGQQGYGVIPTIQLSDTEFVGHIGPYLHSSHFIETEAVYWLRMPGSTAPLSGIM